MAILSQRVENRDFTGRADVALGGRAMADNTIAAFVPVTAGGSTTSVASPKPHLRVLGASGDYDLGTPYSASDSSIAG
jgi:hypothetical protein